MKHHTKLIRRAAVLGVLGALLLTVVLPTMTQSRVQAAEGVNINTSTVTCSSVSVTYTVFGAGPSDYGLIYVFRGSDDSQVQFGTGPATSGQHTATVNFSAEPANTTLYVLVSIGAGELNRVTAQTTPVSCSGGGDTGSGTGGDPGSDGQTAEQPPAPPWSGYSDGRLNPALDEYYTVYCQNDRIDIYRSLPDTLLLKFIPLADVLALGVGAALDLGDFMTLVRNSEDLVTIYGSNGNTAPDPGSKAFSLDACVTANGGAPAAQNNPPQNTGDDGEPDDEETPAEEAERLRQQAEDQIAFCGEVYEFFDGDEELFIDCVASASQSPGASSVAILWALIMQLCLGLPLLVPFAFVLAPRLLNRIERKRGD